MKETTPAAMPPCFDRWCKRFDDIFSHQAQKREFRNYVGGLLGESERKNLSQMADNAVGVTYHRLHTTHLYDGKKSLPLDLELYQHASSLVGLREYQVRDSRSLLRHFILVFCAYTFILWHTLTGGLRRRWANKPLNTFVDALEAFRTAMSFRASGVVEP